MHEAVPCDKQRLAYPSNDIFTILNNSFNLNYSNYWYTMNDYDIFFRCHNVSMF